MRTLVVAGLLAAAVPFAGHSAPASADPAPPVPALPAAYDLKLPAHPSEADLARAQHVVADLAAKAQKQIDAVQKVAGEGVAQRVALAQVQARRASADAALSDLVRTTYIYAGGGDRLLSYLAGIEPDDEYAAQLGHQRALGVDSDVLREAREADAAAGDAAAQLQSQQDALVQRSKPALRLLAQADEALDQARTAFAADQAALAALQAQQASVFAASEALTYAVTPAVSEMGRAAAAAQAPVLDLLEQTPFGQLPKGFTTDGDGLTGVASWYGPGFVGRNTSSGSPYDSEQLTCAMLAVPLGTVVRVTNVSNGRQVSLLVTDHGPYVDGRIIDLSERASRLLGLSLGPVRVEPLQRS